MFLSSVNFSKPVSPRPRQVSFHKATSMRVSLSSRRKEVGLSMLAIGSMLSPSLLATSNYLSLTFVGVFRLQTRR